jgi:hypothetical protein
MTYSLTASRVMQNARVLASATPPPHSFYYDILAYTPRRPTSVNAKVVAGCKPLYLGQQSIDGDGFPIMWVSWNGEDAPVKGKDPATDDPTTIHKPWQAGTDALFYSAASLGLDGYSKPDPASKTPGGQRGGTWLYKTADPAQVGRLVGKLSRILVV